MDVKKWSPAARWAASQPVEAPYKVREAAKRAREPKPEHDPSDYGQHYDHGGE